MKISILLHQDGKQIMFTPENEHDKNALKLIAPGDKLEAVTKWGIFTDGTKTYGLEVDLCQGGYFRGYQSEESLMFVVMDKKEAQSSKREE